MDVEKYTSGKLYRIFEWGFKLIIWNLLSLLLICTFAAIPFFCFFNIQDEVAIVDVKIETNDSGEEEIVVIQNNGSVTNVGKRKITGDIKDISEIDNKIYIYIDDYEIKINNNQNIRNIENAYFENGKLIIKTYLDEYDLGDIYNSNLDKQSTTVDGYQNVLVCYENGVFVNYGKKLDTKSTLSGLLVLIGLVLALFAFIPCYVTTFMMIKIYQEDGSSQTFVLYFIKLWNNFKELFRLELIIVPLISVMAYGLFSYYSIINSMTNASLFFTLSYNFILIALICMVLFILNLPMTIGYFRMKTYTILRFTFANTFRNILYSFLYLLILLVPLALCLINSWLIPVWFLVGLSIPLYFMYHLSSKKYHQMVHDFNSYKEEDILI